MRAVPVAPGTTVERLGFRLRTRDAGPDPRVLLGLALRDNPRRAQLLVSRVLGKHIPAEPRLVHAAGLLLGGLVADTLAGRPPRGLPVDALHAAVRGEAGAAAAVYAAVRREPAARLLGALDTLVLGFAETATALGHCVAEALGGVDYLHSTRRPAPVVAVVGGFSEEHTHHTEHRLLPSDPTLLTRSRPLVLVDDELSTGRTALNTIVALHRLAPRERYVLAALVDVREGALTGLPDGVRVDVVSLARAGEPARGHRGARRGPAGGARGPHHAAGRPRGSAARAGRARRPGLARRAARGRTARVHRRAPSHAGAGTAQPRGAAGAGGRRPGGR